MNLINVAMYPFILLWVAFHNWVYKPIHDAVSSLEREDYAGEHKKWMKKQRDILRRK